MTVAQDGPRFSNMEMLLCWAVAFIVLLCCVAFFSRGEWEVDYDQDEYDAAFEQQMYPG